MLGMFAEVSLILVVYTKIFKFNSFCGLMPLTSGSMSTHLDDMLGLRHAILGTIEVNGWKLLFA